MQKRGLLFYLAGVAIYFLSWVLLLFFPENLWSVSLLGFLAPAYTPLIWLIGIALLGEKFYFPARYKPIYYITPSVLFLIFHCAHSNNEYMSFVRKSLAVQNLYPKRCVRHPPSWVLKFGLRNCQNEKERKDGLK